LIKKYTKIALLGAFRIFNESFIGKRLLVVGRCRQSVDQNSAFRLYDFTTLWLYDFMTLWLYDFPFSFNVGHWSLVAGLRTLAFTTYLSPSTLVAGRWSLDFSLYDFPISINVGRWSLDFSLYDFTTLRLYDFMTLW